MSPLVVDASLALSWVFADEATALTDAIGARVAAEGAAVPWLWHLEVANVLLLAERRGRLAPGQAEAKLADLAAMGIEEQAGGQATAEILALARKHSLSSYDAAYLSLALARGAELGTLDRSLAAAALAEGLAVLPGPA
jgi:predicted nucleic acid-binding protein